MKRSAKRAPTRSAARKAAVLARPAYTEVAALRPRARPKAKAATVSDFPTVTRGQIKAIREALQLSGNELAGLFGVTRQAVEQWETKSVPVDKAAKIDRVAEVVSELAKRFKPQRLPVVVRNAMPILDNRSILQTLQTDGPLAIYEFFRRWSSYVPGIEPIRAGEFT